MADERFPNGWPKPLFLHVAESDATDCELHLEWANFELYVGKDGSFHLLGDDFSIEEPETALLKLRELLDACKPA